MSWIDIGALDDVPERGARLVKTPRGCVAVFRTGPNAAHATADRCPHKGGPLSEGIVHGTRVTCPLHNRVFSLETGAAQGADEGQIAVYPIRIAAGRLLLDAGARGAECRLMDATGAAPVKSACPNCGVGCGVLLTPDGRAGSG